MKKLCIGFGGGGLLKALNGPFLSFYQYLSANHDDVSFKRLIAKKLMASPTFNSIDYLLQVIAAAEAMRLLKESTETIPTHSVDSIVT